MTAIEVWKPRAVSALLVLACVTSSALLGLCSNAHAFSNVFDRASGRNSYINLADASWITSFAGVTPRSGSDFLASGNGSLNTYPVGITKELGQTIANQTYAVSFFITKYEDNSSLPLSGVSFADFMALRIGGTGGTMLWTNTPTPVENAVWVQWSGLYTPSPSDVGRPFLFHAERNLRGRSSIAIDGPVVAQPLIHDADGDGIEDGLDQCPDTTPGTAVDANGCSLDELVPCAGPRSGGALREDQFRTTLWSRVRLAQWNDGSDGANALEVLFRIYWPPVYAFLRRCGHAESWVQGMDNPAGLLWIPFCSLLFLFVPFCSLFQGVPPSRDEFSVDISSSVMARWWRSH